MALTCKNEKGFTILELLIGASIIGVLAGLSAPAIIDYNRNNELRNAPREFADMLQLARTEAIQRNTWVNVETQANDSDNYSETIWVCTAASPTTDCTVNTLIKSFRIGSGNVFIRSTGSSNQADDNISFNSRGNLAENAIDLGFCNSDASSDYSRFLEINVTGRTFIHTFDSSRGHLCNPD